MDQPKPTKNSTEGPTPDASALLKDRFVNLDMKEAAAMLETIPAATALELLGQVLPMQSREILAALPDALAQQLFAEATPDQRRQWASNESYPVDSVGRLMEVPLGFFRPEITVAVAREKLRELVQRAFITYLFVTDSERQLLGVVTMRDLLFGDPDATLESLMLKNPFHLKADMPLMDAMKSVLNRHFPVYPVCDGSGRLMGLVRGHDLFEAQAIELSAQAGSMVGVGKEERLATPWKTSLKFRHPWLQLNLLTAFIAAAVVGLFEGTIERVVVLAVFLPVLAGQSGNTGCQALAVALRGMTLGELKKGKERAMVIKEAILGFCNGALVGISAGIGMAVYATMQKRADAIMLGLIVMFAMTASCIISGLSGALIPLALKKAGADPATASSIFLTTATDVASMGIFLGLATLLIH